MTASTTRAFERLIFRGDRIYDEAYHWIIEVDFSLVEKINDAYKEFEVCEL